MAKTEDMLGYFTAVPNDVMMHSEIAHWTKLTLVALLTYARPSRGKMVVHPKLSTLAAHLGCSDDTIGRAMAELVGYGIVVRTLRGMGRSALTELQHPEAWSLPPRTPQTGGLRDRTQAPAEEDVVEEDKRLRACASAEPEAGEEEAALPDPTFVPNEDTIPTRDLAKRPSQKPAGGAAKRSERLRVGRAIIAAWDASIAPECSLRSSPDRSPATRIAAAKALEALCWTPFKGKTWEELVPLIVGRIKAAAPIVRKTLSFGMLFLSKKPNLARLLGGEWERGRVDASEGQEGVFG